MYDDPFLPGAEEAFAGEAEIDDEVTPGAEPLSPFSSQGPRPSSGSRLTWKQHLEALRLAMTQPWRPARKWPEQRELVYVFDVRATHHHQALLLQVFTRDRLQRGGWGRPRPAKIPREQVALLPEAADREILALLPAATPVYAPGAGFYTYQAAGRLAAEYRLSGPVRDLLVPMLCRTGRCWLRVPSPSPVEAGALEPVRWDEGDPWTFRISVEPAKDGTRYLVAGALHRGDARVELRTPALVLAGGLVFVDGTAARLDDAGAFAWLSHLRDLGPLAVPGPDAPALVGEILALPRVPPVDLPADLRYEEVVVDPRPRLRVRRAPKEWEADRLRATLSFDYDGAVVRADEPGRGVFEAARHRLLVRDPAAERTAGERLTQLGLRPRPYHAGFEPRTGLELRLGRLGRVVATLLAEGWHVEADGKLYRQPGNVHLEATSGVDWFELRGHVEFGELTAELPALLAALRRGESTVVLGDGTLGVLPEEWLERYGALARLATPEGDHLRFGRTQLGVLDALLAELPEARWDAAFARARDQLRRFEGIRPAGAPPSFLGVLRGYQRDGLGWLHFLREFGFGGCLADDMGLGKTVQVLALLEARRRQRRAPAPDAVSGTSIGPSLAVVPRSLVFNWKQEAARFTPELRVLDHTGADRARSGDHFADWDLVITTYGTLRRDVVMLREVRFDYVILDEAQAIKNAATDAAKAARLLRADHRLALSGTPVQNHLGELWSLFEFLNPGMLGAATALDLDGSAARRPDDATRTLLARAVRPFVLRRTKQQVAPELPPRVEQTLGCELGPEQRRLYDELRDHYRVSLLGRVARDGIARSRIHILEALLRLRQAACHPGLVDRTRVDETSAKLDVLLPHLTEVVEEGHKALVFSQFTSFLAIVRPLLDRAGIVHEYLDGRTRDRAAAVARFQEDPRCPVFLISLKAGGLGLNLTAAEYVFLLDPWWNPAVEAQAVDRSHRIGQTRTVFAYRLIARGTVEEKILALQETKRELADSIVSADHGLAGGLTREDLELLLS